MSEKISAAEAYELAVEELFRLRDKRPLPDWTSGEVEAWVFDVHTQWSICNQNWGAAAEEPEWHDVEYSVLAELGSLPLCHVVYSREVYNILASRGRDYDLNCRPIPRPASTARAASTAAAACSSISWQSPNRNRQQSVSAPPAPSRISSPVVEVRRSASPAKIPSRDPTPRDLATPKSKSPIPRPVTPKPVMPKLLLRRPETPKPASLTPTRSPTPPAVPGMPSLGSAMKASSLAPPLSTSNIEDEGVGRSGPSAASDVGPGLTFSLFTIPTGSPVLNSNFPPPLDRRSGFAELSASFKPAKETIPSSGSSGPSHMGAKALAVNTNGRTSSLSPPCHLPQSKDSGASDEEELNVAPPMLTAEEHMDMDEVEASPPPSRCRRQVTSLLSTPPPRKSTRRAHPGSASSKPSGKGKRKFKAIVELENDSEMNVDDSQAVVAKPPLKKRKQVKETIDLPLGFRQRGPGPSKVPVVAGISGGGFGEPTPASAVAIPSTSKTVGVLYIDKDFGEFVEVDGRYWRKDVAGFVGEKYTIPCQQCERAGTQCRKFLTHTVICTRCHYSKCPCTVNGKKILRPVEHYRPAGATASDVLEKISQHRQAIVHLQRDYFAKLQTGEYLDGSEEALRLLRLAPTANAGQSNAVTSAQIEEVEEVIPGPSDTHGTA